MLESHINAIEEVLLAQSRTAKNAGHPNLRGGPREWFIRDFLQNHLPSTLEIGQGEIIDSDSVPNPKPHEYRPQVDVVIYRRDLPKISYSISDCAYLIEGVLATIESKSVLTAHELRKANESVAKNSKLKKSPSGGFMVGKEILKPYTYLVAYDGPSNLKTVADWMINQVKEDSWIPDDMMDMIIVLGKGVVWRLEAFPELNIQGATQNNYWAYINQNNKNLLMLFVHMLTWVAASSSPPNTGNYISKIPFSNIKLI
ncbi:MAG: DUF6602 domain-containing protein [Nitrospirales bacterium]